AVALLAHNPLPAVILLQPTADYQQAQQMHQLAEQLGAVDGVSDVVLDLEWVARLQALLGFAERALVLLAGLLALGVLLVVGNTIRLEIENRRDEIVVVKLVGGTDAFVRRPLLYSGFWYGIGAGGLAWGLIQLLLLYLASALATLIGLYPGDYALIGLDLVSSLVLLVMSGLLGTAGAWLAVVRHLAAVEPR
ncbi:MAG TPA: FtsX-like permease family protein, partial [Motiliproteus sp.]